MNKESQHLPIDLIDPDKRQIRTSFSSLESLADDIKQNGQMQPIMVYANGNGRYTIIFGERRWRACKVGNIPTIWAQVLSEAPSREEIIRIQHRENYEREDPDRIDEARFFKRLMEEEGYSKRQVADISKRTNAYINTSLNWLELEPEIQQLVAKRLLAVDDRVFRALASISSKKTRIAMAEAMSTDKGMTIKGLEAACAQANMRVESANRNPKPVRKAGRPAIMKGYQGQSPALYLAYGTEDQDEVSFPEEETAVDLEPIIASMEVVCGKCICRPTHVPKALAPSVILVWGDTIKTCQKCSSWWKGRNLASCEQCPLVAYHKEFRKSMEQNEPVTEANTGN